MFLAVIYIKVKGTPNKLEPNVDEAYPQYGASSNFDGLNSIFYSNGHHPHKTLFTFSVNLTFYITSYTHTHTRLIRNKVGTVGRHMGEQAPPHRTDISLVKVDLHNYQQLYTY